MTQKILQINLTYSGPWQSDYVTAYTDLAQQIAQLPGLRWKIWLENKETTEAGGIYLFDDEASMQAFIADQKARLSNISAVSDVMIKSFDITEELTTITRGPIS